MTDYFPSQFQKCTTRITDLFGSTRVPEELSTGLLSRVDSDLATDFDSDEKDWHPPISSQASLVIRTTSAILHFFLFALTPSFVYNRFSSTAQPRKLHKTSFLDGLRGVAAFIVVLWHLVPAKEAWLPPPYGINNRDGMGPNLLQLPFIRVLFAGSTMVPLFFVISGYVLSAKHIRMIRSENYEKLAESLVSTIFRRGFRLFLPSIAGQTFFDVLFYIWTSEYPESLGAWIWTFYDNTSTLLYYWEWETMHYSLRQLWTIPIEFVCSMFLFLVILGVSRVRTWIRFLILGLLMLHTFASGRWAVFLFLAGMVIAEIDEIKEEREKIQQATGIKAQGRGPFWKSICHTVVWVGILVVSLYLAGLTDYGGDASIGYEYLRPYTPKVYLEASFARFWASLGAALFLLTICQLPALQVVFTTPIAQYLGDISYSMYIVHYILETIFGDRIVTWAHFLAGGADTQWRRILCVIFEVLMVTPMVVWVADIFCRFVDKPVVTFTRWFDKVCRKPDQANVLGMRS